jgi:virginiamycin A acetyltransferase
MRFDSIFSILAINFFLRFMTVRVAGVKLGLGGWIKCKTTVGYGTGIGWGFCARGKGELNIGKFCAIGENVRVITSNHDMNRLALSYRLQIKIVGRSFDGPKKGVIIGHDVWIGDQVIILPGVSIGNGAIIGAGSVLTKSVEPYSVVVGNPARMIRKRFSEATAEIVEDLAWWDWPEEKMLKLKHLFANNPQAINWQDPNL